jgi:hypothetical protein
METRCPHCGEIIDIAIDPGGGEEQEYVEDCSVCCRPILFFASYSEESRDWSVTASSEI